MLLSTVLLSFVTAALAAPLSEQQLDDFYTRLVRWNGCSAGQKAAIKAGWESIWPIQQYYLDNNVDFNSAAAMEYFGPPANIQSYQARIQEAIKQHATIQPGWTDWFAWRLHVRCDDPRGVCDLCGNKGPWAYTTQQDEQSGLARINFCPRYFNSPSIQDQIAHGKSADTNTKANMDTYAFSQGWVWYHELMHIDWATKGTNWETHVTDIKFVMKDDEGTSMVYPATGPMNNKILARNSKMPGFHTSRNADSFTSFALSRYVESQIGVYPHLPYAPFRKIRPTGLTEANGGQDFDIQSDGTVYYNASSPDTAQVSSTCFVDDETSGDSVEIDKFLTEDQYPADYRSQWEQWVADLGGSTGDSDSKPNDFQPLPKDKQPSCSGTNLNANFPSSWATTDGRASAGQLLYNMRDQACQGKCENIKGLPGNSGNPSPQGYFAAARQSDTGCEYAVKIAADKELYFYVTNDGQNCYDATERMINTCINDRKNDAGWINGPNYGEFYQVGVRALNGAGSHHGGFPDDKNNHLGYRQVACQRTDNGKSDLWYGFRVEITDWDDGNYGRTIRDHAKKCGLLSKWKYEDEPSFAFADGRKADKYASWRLPLLIGDRCGEKAIEAALGLQSGSVTCKRGEWTEVAMF
ncbi:hypothetical protein Hte_011384 [Hypoxylon texense]